MTEKAKKNQKQLAEWIAKEITSREYSKKELETIALLLKANDQKEAWNILLKDHQCPATCLCQKKANSWQEKINKAQRLLQLAEKEGKSAQELRIKETTKLLFQQPK